MTTKLKIKLYRVDVKLCATAYIKAASEAEAMTIAKGMNGDCIFTDAGLESDVPVTGLPYSDPELPDVSLSPAMTCYGPFDEETEAEQVEE